MVLSDIFDSMFRLFTNRFTIKVEDCRFFHHPDKNCCPAERQLHIAESIKYAMEQIEIGKDLVTKTSPLIYSRTSRGGKTTFLQHLFEALSEQYCPIAISFNYSCNHKFKSTDTPKTKLLKAIASCFVHESVDLSACNITEASILAHIEKAPKPMILLIDELNSLKYPLDEETSMFLKENFLDKRNRYLVYTTHLFMEVDDPTMVATTWHYRDMKIISPSECFNVKEMKKLPGCEAVTSAEVALYGGIPSLVYSVKNKLFSPEERFIFFFQRNLRLSEIEKREMFKDFVECIISGGPTNSLQLFEKFASGGKGYRLKFPLCYLKYICKLLQGNGMISSLIDFFLDTSETVTDRREKELKKIFEMAILFQGFNLISGRGDGPFGISQGFSPIREPYAVEHFFLPIQAANVDKLEAARSFIMSKLSTRNINCTTFYLFSPQDDQFPIFDGFICFRRALADPIIYAYRIKTTTSTFDHPKGIEDWIDQGIFICGEAPVVTIQRSLSQFWLKASPAGIKRLLGYSLRDLMPLYWDPLTETSNYVPPGQMLNY